MIPLDPYVIRFTPTENDRDIARQSIKMLFASELGAAEACPAVLTLSPALNKLLQNVFACLADGSGMSFVVLRDRDLLPVRAAAEILGYGTSQVTRMVHSGSIKAHEHPAGRKILIPASEIAAISERRRAKKRKQRQDEQ